MIKKVFILLLVVFLGSCSENVTIKDIELLNGYWEITKVETPEGESKTFESNNHADYFELKEMKGIRTKVVNQLDGTIQSNGLKENFFIKDSANAFYLNYQTEFSRWTEKLEQLNENELVILNKNNIRYTYKRFTPINSDE